MSKVYVFDLDNTLYLWDVSKNYKLEYEYKLVKFLKDLKENNNILAIASHNTSPRYYLRKMNLSNYFDYIIGEYPRKKSDMIIEILKNIVTMEYTKKDVIFFDDLDYNIRECRENDIISIKVDPVKGIDFENFI